MRTIYLHGFASRPASRKATFFKERFAERGIDLVVPELDGGNFRNLTITGQLRIIAEHAGEDPVVLIGSSLGGYLAALAASRYNQVKRVVLMAPAFRFARRWEYELGTEVFEEWRQTGSRTVFHYGAGENREIGFGLIEDARQYEDYPDVTCPALLLHGTLDDVVPIEFSREFARRHRDSAKLHEFVSNHELGDVLPEMWSVTSGFLFHDS